MRPDKTRVLLIEDRLSDTNLILRMLSSAEKEPFEVHHVAELSRGLQHLRSHRTDVVLLDLGLPDSQGLDTLDKVRTAAPNVPIIVLTVTDLPPSILDAIKKGARDYF